MSATPTVETPPSEVPQTITADIDPASPSPVEDVTSPRSPLSDFTFPPKSAGLPTFTDPFSASVDSSEQSSVVYTSTELPPAIVEEDESESESSCNRRSNSGEIQDQSSATSNSCNESPVVAAAPSISGSPSELSIGLTASALPSEVTSPRRRSISQRIRGLVRRNPSATDRELKGMMSPDAMRSPADPNGGPRRSSTSHSRRFSMSKYRQEEQVQQRPPSPPTPTEDPGFEMATGRNRIVVPANLNIQPEPSVVISPAFSSPPRSSTGLPPTPRTTGSSSNLSSQAHPHGHRYKRASSALNMARSIFGRTKHVALVPPKPENEPSDAPSRSNSYDANHRRQMEVAQHVDPVVATAEHHAETAARPMQRSPWGYIANTGTGVKSRRMSISVDELQVITTELHEDYAYPRRLRNKTLGKGATSTVTMMVDKHDSSKLFAVKEYRAKSKQDTQEEYEKKLKSEYTISHSLHHPNIVETYGLATHKNKFFQIMEYCGNGDLFSLASSTHLRAQPLAAGEDPHLRDRACIFKQLVRGVAYLHENGIAHRDIKMENLLISDGCFIKITDFGVSDVFSGLHPGLREARGCCGQDMGPIRLCKPGICGSEPYIAPEVLAKQGDYDPRPADVWSCAVVLIQLTFSGSPWTKAAPDCPAYVDWLKSWDRFHTKMAENEVTEWDILNGTVKGAREYVAPADLIESNLKYWIMSKYISGPWRRLIFSMLHPDPTKRSTIHEILGHRLVNNAECCQVSSYDEVAPVCDVSKVLKSSKNTIRKHSHIPPKHTSGTLMGRSGL